VTSGSFRFDRFLLDPAERQLRQDGVPLEINARYLDALALMVSEQGKLISKDRFLEEVWRGVPVTDEALTQCIKSLRRMLGDDAARPRFIETVPKHGYRFIAQVDGDNPKSDHDPSDAKGRRVLLVGGAGTIGGGWAGLIGGLIYGFAGASQPLAPGTGAVSVLLVLLCVTILVALMGGAGVSIGIAVGASKSERWWSSVLGGAAGGLLVGAVVKLLGIDAFTLLLGRSPGDITGAAEGLVLGGAVGLGTWLAGRMSTLRKAVAASAVIGGLAGALIIKTGGRLMAGSLDLLAQQFPDSRFRMDEIGALFGESGLGPIGQLVTGTLEGALFAACVVAAIGLARRELESRR
jgi:DNA-binding winged helix-turn-helix (wHTH) protein